MARLSRTACILLLIIVAGQGIAFPTAYADVGVPFSIEEEWEEEPDEWEVEDEEEEWAVEEDEGEWVVEEEGEVNGGAGEWEVSSGQPHRDALEPCTPHRANASVVVSKRRNAARPAETSKVRAGKAFAADLDIAIPSYCEHRHKPRLTTKGRLGGREPAR